MSKAAVGSNSTKALIFSLMIEVKIRMKENGLKITESHLSNSIYNVHRRHRKLFLFLRIQQSYHSYINSLRMCWPKCKGFDWMRPPDRCTNICIY